MSSETVANKSPSRVRMAAKWGLVDGLLGGTAAMRAGKETFLPKHEAETHKGYRARLKKGFLYEALADAIERVVSKPFAREVAVKGALPEMLDLIRDNADQRGRNLTQFARDVFQDGVGYGLSHILVDFPTAGAGLNLGAQRRLNLHPYFTHVRHDDLWGARWEELPTGKTRLQQVRIHEVSVEEEGAYGEAETEYIRVINAPTLDESGINIVAKGTWELWKKDGNSEWVMKDNGEHTFPGIPMVTYYAARTGFLEASVPFRKVADLNLAHWQSSTDQRNILSVCRVAILFGSGFTAKEVQAGITIGPNNFIFSTNPEATLEHVEHTGNAINAGRQDLEDLKAEMASMSLTPMLQKSGNPTATGKAIDESKNESVAQSWIRGLEGALFEAFQMAATWAGVELMDDVAIGIHSDFGLSQRAIQDLKALEASYLSGAITHKLYLDELKRRGVLREDLDVEAEVEAVKTEPPRVPFLGDSEGNDEINDDLDEPKKEESE